MTLLTVVKDVCAVVGVTVPASVTLNIAANRTMQEMLALANEMAQRIAYDNRDWQTLRAAGQFIGDGVKLKFPLPANYKRLMLTSNVWRGDSNTTPMQFVPNHDDWVRLTRGNAIGAGIGGGMWTISGGEMYISPVLALDEKVYFYYIDKNCIALNSSGYGDRFLDENDSFRLDERLLKLGMTWQWKANKGTSYAEDMGTYSDALAMAMGHDSPAPIIMGRRPISANARVAYPWPVPT